MIAIRLEAITIIEGHDVITHLKNVVHSQLLQSASQPCRVSAIWFLGVLCCLESSPTMGEK